MLYVAYLDEFGHIGAYTGPHGRHNTSPVFGLGGIVLPAESVRDFEYFFVRMKKTLLASEITARQTTALAFEKKGSTLYRTTNIDKYPELTHATYRLFNKIAKLGGFTYYVGVEKERTEDADDPKRLYSLMLRLAVKGLDAECRRRLAHVLLFVDESDKKFQRSELHRSASIAMFGRRPASRVIDQPVFVDSTRHQRIQAADWICGLLGRLFAFRVAPRDYERFSWAELRFGERLDRLSSGSQLRQGAGTAAERAGHPDEREEAALLSGVASS